MIPGLIFMLIVGAAILAAGIILLRLPKRGHSWESGFARALMTIFAILCLVFGGITLLVPLLFLCDLIFLHVFQAFGFIDASSSP